MGLHFFPQPDNLEKEIRDKARAFGDKYLRPTAIEDDLKGTFRRDAYNHAAELGLTSILVPKQYGGQELPSRCFFAAVEEVTRASASMTVTIGVNNLSQSGIIAYGSEAQKKKYLPKMVTGSVLGAFSLSEPGSGSDAAGLKLKAEKVAGGFRLNGTKCWCSTAGYADVYWVMARTGGDKINGISAFLIDKDTPGFRVGKYEKKLGLGASTLAELVFEDCFIQADQILGREGDGFKMALAQLDPGRITIGIAGLALAIEAIERTWKFRTEQSTKGLPFEDGEKFELADFFARIQAVKNLVRTVSDRKDEKKSITLLASQIKILGSDIGMQCTSRCVEMMREWGYTRELEVERLFRDAKALQIVEGTNQIQRQVLIREMGEMIK